MHFATYRVRASSALFVVKIGRALHCYPSSGNFAKEAPANR